VFNSHRNQTFSPCSTNITTVAVTLSVNSSRGFIDLYTIHSFNAPPTTTTTIQNTLHTTHIITFSTQRSSVPDRLSGFANTFVVEYLPERNTFAVATELRTIPGSGFTYYCVRFESLGGGRLRAWFEVAIVVVIIVVVVVVCCPIALLPNNNNNEN
jgi:hypothetical protein